MQVSRVCPRLWCFQANKAAGSFGPRTGAALADDANRHAGIQKDGWLEAALSCGWVMMLDDAGSSETRMRVARGLVCTSTYWLAKRRTFSSVRSTHERRSSR